MFDGYGEMDTTSYSKLGGRSGGYIASRLAAESTLKMFQNGNFTFSEMDSIKLGSDLKKYIEKVKKNFTTDSDRALLPTTASIVACDFSKQDTIMFEYLWAGNSRGYLLDKSGLCQITKDDLVEEINPIVPDQKPRVINLINGETDFKINIKSVKTERPSVVVTATDGAYSCFSTPMEFEYALLYTLNRAKSISQWEHLLKRLINELANDVFTVMIAGFGFDDFKDLKRYFFERTKSMYSEYVDPIFKARENNSIEEIDEMWNKYKKQYYR
ncbi:MAG: hypothetical protein SO152_04270 [Ruminococcus sp.]|nr:hypothetical protein [Ruminococcus sp.]